MKKHDIKLENLSNELLINYLNNARRYGEHDLANQIARELDRRGAFPRKLFKLLPWNDARAAEILRPFADVAISVVDSRRTTYTNGGGYRRRPKAHPERMCVDSYSAIKRGTINATFSVRIKRPGDEPEFEMMVNGEIKAFDQSDLAEALAEWQQIAAAA